MKQSIREYINTLTGLSYEEKQKRLSYYIKTCPQEESYGMIKYCMSVLAENK